MDMPSLKTRVSAEEWQLRCDLAACYRLVAHYGWSDLVFTHITARVPGPEHHFLINPYGLMFDEITASSLVKVDAECNKVIDSPFPVNPAGFIIHSAVHEAREDAGCVLHTHTRAGVAAGGNGAGQVAKVCNNMLLAIHMIGSAEALNLGVSLGLDASVLSDIMKQSSGDNWSLQKYNPMPGVMEGVPASRDYSGGFGTDLMLKDLGLAEEAALGAQTPIPLGGLARQLYALHSAGGNGGLDFSSILRMLQKA